MPKKKSKTAKAKKKKMTEMSQTHAMEEKPKKYVPSTLDQIWGDTGLSKYQTLSEGEYQTQLENFNKSDLQTHAIRIGVLPIDNSVMLKNRLLGEFKKHVASYKRPQNDTSNIKLSSRAKKILREGK